MRSVTDALKVVKLPAALSYCVIVSDMHVYFELDQFEASVTLLIPTVLVFILVS